MRQIIFDTETTGMTKVGGNPAQDHRIIEIGCVELVDRLPTGNHFHIYLNPERAVDPGAFRVHGIGDDFLADKPVFADIIDQFEAYLAGADELIAHNIAFDRAFLDQELALAGRDYRLADRFILTDSLLLAREKFASARNNLDALCSRFGIDNSNRDLHGALLDAELLAEVYLKLTGGQSGLWEQEETGSVQEIREEAVSLVGNWLVACASTAERDAHERILAAIRKS
ncbi:MAG: DNA polymerase III subunit epsilon [Cardiobacteriaceae bacterium]|nr:DNA polymerase III subunit epsilon [Cardiobacteriaceae bacterium]